MENNKKMKSQSDFLSSQEIQLKKMKNNKSSRQRNHKRNHCQRIKSRNKFDQNFTVILKFISQFINWTL